MKKTGKAKAKQIKDFAGLGTTEKLLTLKFESSLHGEAFDFMQLFHQAVLVRSTNPITLKEHLKGINWSNKTLGINPITLKEHLKGINNLWDKATNHFAKKFVEAYRQKNGRFFRALADVLEHSDKNPNYTERERFIYMKCFVCEKSGLPLPSASQILRSWKIKCGLMPTRRSDLNLLWSFHYSHLPTPSSREEIENKLRRWLNKPDEAAADVQIVEIQRDAKKVGYILPKQTNRNCLPAGWSVKRLH